MSLSIEVGSLALQHSLGDKESIDWAQEKMDNINAVLSDLGIQVHEEPSKLPLLVSRARIKSFNYSILHHLRRAYAYYLDTPTEPIEYLDESEDPAEDILLDLEVDRMRSHLISHSDTEGFYFPVDFEKIVMDMTDEDRVPGLQLGSSYQLKRELEQIAAPIGVKLQDGILTDEEAERVNQAVSDEESFYQEQMAWIALWEMCRLSIEHSTAIEFC